MADNNGYKTVYRNDRGVLCDAWYVTVVQYGCEEIRVCISKNAVMSSNDCLVRGRLVEGLLVKVCLASVSPVLMM